MGNNSSKQSKKDGLQSYPSFSRTDTQGSTRSARSIRSKLSINSDHGSFKSALEQYEDSGSFSGGAGAGAGVGGVGGGGGGSVSNSYVNDPLPPPPDLNSNSYSSSPKLTANDNSASNGGSLNPNDGMDGYPFPTVLPRSMQQIAPKEPILMRRDKDGNFTAPNTPGTDSFNSSVVGVDSAVDSNSGSASQSQSQSQIGLGLDSDSNNNNSNSNNNDISIENISNSSTPLSSSTPINESFNNSLSNSFSNTTPLASLPSTPRNIPTIHRPASPLSSLNIEEIIQRLLDAGYSGKTTRSVCLKNSEIVLICQVAREIFLSQPTLLELSTPVKIVGDVHGQYGDLIRLFDMCGFPPAANYLFLGDYVDRGKQSLETILLLLCYKIKYPENFFLLRGNHECANVTRVYGFFDECKRRCNTKTWKIFIDTFNALPIAAVVAQKIFCVHGGLSPALNNLNEIRNIERPTDVPDYGLLNDLLWSDPADTGNEWEDNERGVSYCFNKVAINKFLTKFSFDLVCRAHMVVEDGYEFFNERSLVTVFSAPNYCGEFDNWGAVMSVSEGLLCSFELLKPLDSVALKQVMKKGKHERRTGLLTSPSPTGPQSY